VETVEPLGVSSTYVWRAAGWYNMVGLYKRLIVRLLESQQEELKELIECVGWMQFRWDN